VYATSDSTQSVVVFDTATDTEVATIKTSQQEGIGAGRLSGPAGASVGRS
jgi:hypothetical protein